MDRLNDQVCDKVVDALTRMLAFGEQVDSIEFALQMLQGPQGMMAVGVIQIALKGPVLGSVLRNFDIVTDLNLLSSQPAIDASVRASLDSLRSQRAAVLAGTNGHSLVLGTR